MEPIKPTDQRGTLVHISCLTPWEDNPKTSTEPDVETLTKILEMLGVHSPLLVTPEGIVIGGNQRLQAMKRLSRNDPKWSSVWVSVIEVTQGEDSLYHVTLNGVAEQKTFLSKEAAWHEYGLSHNHITGKYEMDLLANIKDSLDVDFELFKVNTKLEETLATQMNNIAPNLDEEPVVDHPQFNPEEVSAPPPGENLVQCPDCSCVFDPEKHKTSTPSSPLPNELNTLS